MVDKAGKITDCSFANDENLRVARIEIARGRAGHVQGLRGKMRWWAGMF